MKSNFPKTALVDDDEWERMSNYSLVPSHNTGFTAGTSALRPDGRLLNFEVDEYLIRCKQLVLNRDQSEEIRMVLYDTKKIYDRL